jgi:hypothetical protein
MQGGKMSGEAKREVVQSAGDVFTIVFVIGVGDGSFREVARRSFQSRFRKKERSSPPRIEMTGGARNRLRD